MVSATVRDEKISCMSEPQFLKCTCAHCGGHIEFPAEGVGVTVDCPHCAGAVLLTATPPPVLGTAQPPRAPVATPTAPAAGAPASGSGKRGRLIGGIAAVFLLVVVAGVVKKFRGKSSSSDGAAVGKTVKPGAVPPPPEPEPPPRVPGEDLQVLKQQIQKAEQGSLRYVSGVVTNHGDRQFFNVKVEFEMLNTNGQVVGNATDYLGNLAPHTAWNFRAQILDRDAAKLRLTKLAGEKE